MVMKARTRSGITTTTIQAPSTKLVTVSDNITTPAGTAPEPVPLVGDLAWHVPVAGEDGRQPGEAGVRRVGGEQQDERGRGLHGVIRRAAPEHAGRALRHDGLAAAPDRPTGGG